jgi:hypothetical protein
MHRWIRIACAPLTLAAASALAQPPNYGPLPYDYLFANYALTELDRGGIELGGSIGVANRVNIFGTYHSWELDNGADRSGYRIGAGYRWAFSTTVDAIAKLAYAKTELDPPGQGPEFDDEGLILSGEIRAWLSQKFELSGELSLDDSFRNDLDTVLEFGGQFHLNPGLSVGGRLRVDDNDTTLLLGARFYFGGSRAR